MQNHLLGYCKLRNEEEFRDWLRTDGIGEAGAPINTKQAGWWHSMWKDYGYTHQGVFGKDANGDAEVINIFDNRNTFRDDACGKEFFGLLRHLEETGQKLGFYYDDGTAILTGYGMQRFIMPTEWFEKEPLSDYDRISPSELKALSGEANEALFPATVYYSMSDLREQKSAYAEQENELKQEKKAIEDGTEESIRELADRIREMQEELEEKQKALMAELEQKKKELADKQQELQRKIYVLDTHIYGIRCYLGEVIRIHKIREGKEADAESPVVLHQKIRFLDEELGKYASLYDFDGEAGNKADFLKLLECRDDMVDLFAPSPKCMSVLKVSRTGKIAAVSENVANTLDEYAVYHGGQIAVLFRNGSNLYITWLDEDRVRIRDDNAFYNPDAKSETYEDDGKTMESSSTEDRVSRYFLFSMLQGVLDHGGVFDLPEKVNVYQPGKYIVFSMADGWLQDTAYGSLGDILGKSAHIPLLAGDAVLAGFGIGRDDALSYRSRYGTYNNDRGIGDRNRTHDAYITNGIHTLNKILCDLEFEITYEKEKGVIEEGNRSYSWTEYTNGTSQERSRECKAQWMSETGEIIGKGYKTVVVPWDRKDIADLLRAYEKTTAMTEEGRLVKAVSECAGLYNDSWFYMDGERERESRLKTTPVILGISFQYALADQKEYAQMHYRKNGISIRLVRKIPHYFVSVNAESYKGTTYKTNMEINPSEFIPLPYLCPTWLRYVITTGNIGDFRINGMNVSYAQSLKYLKNALQYAESEYAKAEEILRSLGYGNWIDRSPDWDVTFTEWRIKNRTRKITKHSVTAFSKSVLVTT